MKKRKVYALRYKIFLWILMIIFMTGIAYANDCINYTGTIDEVTIYGSGVDSRGWIKYDINLSGNDIDFNSLTGTLAVNLVANDIPGGEGINVGMIHDDGTTLLTNSVANILAYEVIGNYTNTAIGGSGTGVRWINITNALRELQEGDENLTLMMNNPDESGDPSTLADPSALTIFYVGGRTPTDAQVDAVGVLPEIEVCYSLVPSVTNSSWNATSTNVLQASGKAWNLGEPVNVSSDLLSFVVNASSDSNMSCSLDNDVNYTTMVALDPNYKAATTSTKEHSYTLYDSLSIGLNTMYCSFIRDNGEAETELSSSGPLYINYKDIYYPNVTFKYQSPPDIQNFNGLFLETSWFINDNIGIDEVYSLSSVNSTDDIFYCIQGECTSGSIKNFYENLTISSNNYTFGFEDNQVYGGIYPLDEDYFDITEHTSYPLNSQSDLIKGRLYNMTFDEINYLEVMVNTTGSSPMGVFYCNSTYTSGGVPTSPYCSAIGNIQADSVINHTHSQYSWHSVVPFNTIDGRVNDIQVTPLSYFIFRGGNGWSYYAVSNNTGNIQTSANTGIAWSSETYQLNMHLHQFNRTDFFQYSICANDTYGNLNCSARSDSFDFDILAPNPPLVSTNETNYVYDDISINWTNSTTFQASEMRYYLLELIDADFLQVSDFGNQSLDLSYVLDTTTISDGYYSARVFGYDNNSLETEGYSEFFYIDNNNPTVSGFKTNTTRINLSINLTINMADGVNLNGWRFGTNASGTWNVSSYQNISGLSDYQASFTLSPSETQKEEFTYIGYYFEAIDMTGRTSSVNSSFEVTAESSEGFVGRFALNQCPDTIALALMVLVFIIIIVCFIVYGEIINMSMLILIASVMTFGLGWYIIGCSGILGFSVILAGLLILTRSIIKMNST